MEEKEPHTAIPAAVLSEWEKEFEAAARRPLQTRLRYAFVHIYKPVLDDAPYRSFSTTAEYRAWCAENLPEWLGYGPAVEESSALCPSAESSCNEASAST